MYHFVERLGNLPRTTQLGGSGVEAQTKTLCEAISKKRLCPQPPPNTVNSTKRLVGQPSDVFLTLRKNLHVDPGLPHLLLFTSMKLSHMMTLGQGQ